MIPHGLAHGSVVVHDYAECAYKCDALYYLEDENDILWKDPTIDIDWSG